MLDKEKPSDLFFDLDHTLWDFEKNSSMTFERVFQEMRIQLALENFLLAYEEINHRFWMLYRENKITQLELRHQRLIHTFQTIDYDYDPNKINQISDLYIRYLSTFTHLFEGTIPLLEELKQKYQIHIITNGFEGVQQRKIENSGLSPFVDKIITAEKVGYKKPNPIIFEYALEQTATDASKSIMIGDSLEADILGALAVGMGAIHFNSHNEPQHDYCPVVNSLRDIQNLL
tara:strand:+ start:855 stop:1547 length:693 start_codon:yes stop_codon:yes gene_type:complete